MKKIIISLFIACTLVSNTFAAKSLKDLAKNAAKKVLTASGQKAEEEKVVLTPETALYSFLKGTESDLSDEYLAYAQVIEGKNYKQFHNDPFEWEDKFSQYKKDFEEKVKNANLDQVYVISTTIEFGDYDFTEQGYKVSINENMFFPMDSVYYTTDDSSQPDSDTYFRNGFGLKIQDLEKYTFIPMEKNAAKTFLQGRKNSYGDIRKDIVISFSYKLAAFDSDEYNAFAASIANQNKIPLVGIIQGPIEVYDRYDNFKKIGELIIK